jgi:hypothetical protein
VNRAGTALEHHHRLLLLINAPGWADVAPVPPRVMVGRGETTMPPLFVIPSE